MVDIENTKASSEVKRMFWGFGVDWWTGLVVLLVGLSGVFVIASGLATWVAYDLTKKEAKDASDALEKYKSKNSGQVAEAKTAGIEAGKAAGGALLKAATLEKDAATARERTAVLEKEAVAFGLKIVAAEASAADATKQAATANEEAAKANERTALVQKEALPRTIGVTGRGGIFDTLKPFAGTPALILAQPDFEPTKLGRYLTFVLQQAGWDVRWLTFQEVNADPYNMADDVSIHSWGTDDKASALGGAGSPEVKAYAAASALVEYFRLWHVSAMYRGIGLRDGKPHWRMGLLAADTFSPPKNSVVILIGGKKPNMEVFMEQMQKVGKPDQNDPFSPRTILPHK